MFMSYPFPKRVCDLRGGANVGVKLILWTKKSPLLTDSANQRPLYVPNYSDMVFSTRSNYWKQYKKHIFLPFAKQPLCYQAIDDGDNTTTTSLSITKFQTWSGNTNLKYSSKKVFQIAVNTCSNDDAKQRFTPIFP